MDRQLEQLLRARGAELPPLEGYPLVLRRFHAGDRLAEAGDPLEWLSFLAEGRARVYTGMENGRVVLHEQYSGVRAIGELELLMDAPALASDVQAVSDGWLIVIPLAQARDRLLSDAAMLRFLGREVARKLEHSSRCAAQDRLYPLANRLAAYLLFAQDSGVVKEPLTRISELMGDSYRHLLRTLRDFCDRGLLVREADGYRIMDSAALRSLGGGMRYD